MVATTSSSIPMGTRSCCARCSRAQPIHSTPLLTLGRVPLFSWIVIVCTGRSLSATALERPYLLKPSQPRETSSTAPTFGCVSKRRITWSAYSLGKQPVKPIRCTGWPGKALTIRRATWCAHSTI
ncbi:hypothetical protein D3C87_835750 [compost metagenome]